MAGLYNVTKAHYWKTTRAINIKLITLKLMNLLLIYVPYKLIASLVQFNE